MSKPVADAGSGPQAVPSDANTYAAIQVEDERRDLAERSLGRWAAEAKAPLPPSEVPKQSCGPWAVPDGLGIDAPVDVNPADPSGVNRNRGI